MRLSFKWLNCCKKNFTKIKKIKIKNAGMSMTLFPVFLFIIFFILSWYSRNKNERNFILFIVRERSTAKVHKASLEMKEAISPV